MDTANMDAASIDRASMETWPGSPYPLGATFDGSGTNFSIFSSIADAVTLCVFDDDDTETRIDLVEVNAHVWHAYLPQVEPGTRATGTGSTARSTRERHRCDPSKLLADPYAKAMSGTYDWQPPLFSYRFDAPDQRNDADSAAHTMHSVVVNPFFDWAATDRSGSRTPSRSSTKRTSRA
jgi:isoamylase